jgi:tetratricopeptide (TPR) repeat protein
MKSQTVYLFLLPCALLLAGCASGRPEREYAQIKASGLSGEALLKELTEFELRNMGHFSAKVDLGTYYVLSGNMERAKDYLRRAQELVSKAPRTPETRKNTAVMYGSLARIALLQKEYDKSLEYVEKAIDADTEAGIPFRFLQAHILIARNEQDKAGALFDELYKTHKEQMSADDIRAYLSLLVRSNRTNECAGLVDYYFEKGVYYAGLGLFASSVYESAHQAEKAIFAAFLDYEYYSGYTVTNDQDFLKNIDNLEQQLAQKGILRDLEPVLHLIRGLYRNPAAAYTGNRSGFFVEDYILLKKKIITDSITFPEFEQYLKLEHYFSRFPVYYWNLWRAASKLRNISAPAYIPALEKIITLDKDGRYAKPAWEELTKLMGYTEK